MQTKSALSMFPLVKALDIVDFWLTRGDDPRIIIASASERKFLRQDLPPHIRTTSRPLKGKRKVLRGAWHYHMRLLQAQWPDDQMDESTLPCLLCVISGNANIYVGNYILHCSVGDFIYIPAGVPKGDRFYAMQNGAGAEQSEVLWCYPGGLLGEGIECWISHYHDNEPVQRDKQAVALVKNHCLAALFTQLCEDIERAASKEILFALTKSFLLLLHRDIQEGRALIPPTKRLYQPVERTRDPIEYAIRYTDAHLNDHLTIEKIARQSAISATSFKKRFREATGQTFNQYLRMKRADFAAHQLETSDVSIQKIAHYVGLTYSQLNNLFRDFYQCTPGEYRKRQNETDI